MNSIITALGEMQKGTWHNEVEDGTRPGDGGRGFKSSFDPWSDSPDFFFIIISFSLKISAMHPAGRMIPLGAGPRRARVQSVQARVVILPITRINAHSNQIFE